MSPPDAEGPNEVSVAINPRDPENIIAVSAQRRSTSGGARSTNYAYVTRDGGKTWTAVATSNAGKRRQGDDAIAFDAEGIAHHSYISFRGINAERPPNAATGIFVTTSRDKGKSWSAPVPVVDHVNTVLPFEDKPYVVADRTPGSPHYGHLYVAWTRFTQYGSASPRDTSDIYFSHSEDGGKTFAMPFRISDAPGDALDGDGTVEGAVPAVGLKGEVYVAWAGPRGIEIDRSFDGGWSFGGDRVIARMPGGWDSEVPGIGRANGMPVTKVDSSEGRFRGSVYVNWIDARNGDLDVFVTASRDGGETWSEPRRVNDDALKNGKAQFFTWMAVDPVDGSVNVAFYDRRDFEGTRTGLTLARSVDGGETFVNTPIAIEPFSSNENVFFGDYSGIDAYGGLVVPVFTHFLPDGQRLAISAALFRFRPGTQDLR